MSCFSLHSFVNSCTHWLMEYLRKWIQPLLRWVSFTKKKREERNRHSNRRSRLGQLKQIFIRASKQRQIQLSEECNQDQQRITYEYLSNSGSNSEICDNLFVFFNHRSTQQDSTFFDSIDEKEFAQQLTLIEWRLFSSIHPTVSILPYWTLITKPTEFILGVDISELGQTEAQRQSTGANNTCKVTYQSVQQYEFMGHDWNRYPFLAFNALLISSITTSLYKFSNNSETSGYSKSGVYSEEIFGDISRASTPEQLPWPNGGQL